MAEKTRRLTHRWPAYAVATLVVLGGLAGVAKVWLIPGLLSRAIGNAVGAEASVSGWWVNGRSAGVTGLVLREQASGSAVIARADRATTDLTLRDILSGHFRPRRVTLSRPRLALRLDASGKPLTTLRPRQQSKSGAESPSPVITADGATLTIQQAGRPEMVVTNVLARVVPDGTGLNVAARSSDPNWGPLEAMGQIAADLASGRVELKTTRAGIAVTPEKVKAIPFVPPRVWDHIAPTGDIAARVTVEFGVPKEGAVHVVTELTPLGATMVSPSLGVTLTDATGRITVDGALIRFEGLTGKAVDGRITGNGTLDFGRPVPQADISLDLTDVDVTRAPERWQLAEAGITGRLNGKARVVAAFKSDGIDLSGTNGDAVVHKGVVQGIRFDTLRLTMTASGDDIHYENETPGSPTPVKAGSPLASLKTLKTRLEFDDVEIARILERAQFFLGFPFPLPITGQLSVKADATIPLGHLRNVKAYVFHGTLALRTASLFKVDIGRLSARVDLENGALNLTDVRGRLIDDPSGGPNRPPDDAGEEVPLTGPIPSGAFRGELHASFDPPGPLTARFEGIDLPLGELAAPVLPRPTPLSGLATIRVDASADLRSAFDPKAWSVSAMVESRAIRFHSARLDRVTIPASLKGGRLIVSELTAGLDGQPLKATGELDLTPPHTFRGTLDVENWSLQRVLAWKPGGHAPPYSGLATAHATASGTIAPFTLTTEGRGQISKFQGGPVAVGALPFSWVTRRDDLVVTVYDSRPFGGKISAEATIPLQKNAPATVWAKVENVDAGQAAAALPGDGLKVAGRVTGRLDAKVPRDVSSVEATLHVTSPDLTFEGFPAETLKVDLTAHGGAIRYQATAESLGGTVLLKGDLPLGASALRLESSAELRVVGFVIDRLLKAQGISGPLARLGGVGALDANLKAVLSEPSAGLYARGITELRDLKWAGVAPLGKVRGEVTLTPAGWRIEPISGDLLGGSLSGFIKGGGVSRPSPSQPLNFEVKLDHASLKSAAALVQGLDVKLEGRGNLRASGTLTDALRVSAEADIGRARVAGLPLTELRVPVEVLTTQGNAAGTLHLRRWSARLAGGRLRGDASFRIGEDHSFQSEANVSDLDLETILRSLSDARQPATGRVSGKVLVSGTSPTNPGTYRGKIHLDLDDASLVALPIFKEIDRFLGAARGGLFEHGDLIGSIGNRQITVESLTLEGRLAQLHVSGTVGFDRQLALVVLVNTNQIIPQTGQSLVSVIPGLGGLRGRNGEASLRVANFLSNRLLKFRVNGTVDNPSVALDPTVAVAGGAVGFFAGVLKLPLGFVK